MSPSLVRCILVSLAVHAVICLWWFPGNRPVPLSHDPIEVSRYQASPGENAFRSGPSSGSTTQSLAIKDLMLSPDGETWAATSAKTEIGEWATGGGASSATAVLGTIRFSVLYDHLYQRIDHSLHYPPEFKEEGIEGLVKAELDLRKTEAGVQVFYRVKSSSPYLRVYVIQRLREILSAGIPSPYVPEGRALRIHCNFHFELTRTENALDPGKDAMVGANRNGIRGDRFSFYRAGKLIGQWKVGPLAGYAFVPAVGLDLEWIQNQITNVASDGPPLDPLAKYRSDPAWAAD